MDGHEHACMDPLSDRGVGERLMRYAGTLACLLLLLWASAGCGAFSPSPISASTVSSPTLEATLGSSATPAAPPTTPPPPHVSPTASPSLAATYPTDRWTLVEPSPVLPLDQAIGQIRSLLEENGGCRIPCWWGITPGKTSEEAAIDELSQSSRVYVRGSGPFGSSHTIESVSIVETRGERTQIVTDYFASGDLIDAIRINALDLSPVLTLKSMLEELGEPERILVATFSQPAEQGSWPFGLVLFYPSSGVLAEYYISGRAEDDHILACPATASAPFVGVWETGLEFSFEDAHGFFGAKGIDWSFKDLELATNMDIESFYSVFRAEGAADCFVTPKSIWKPASSP